MNTKFFVFLFSFLLINCNIYAAKKVSPFQSKADMIMAQPETYIYGIGYSEDPEEAYNAAVHDMVRKISLTVTGRSIIESTNVLDADGTVTTTENFESVVESYTAPASLEGVESMPLSDGPEFCMFVYMPKANIEKMHKRRRNNVGDLARAGIRARDNGKVDDALRHLYRAYVLLQSLPAPSGVEEIVDGEKRVLANWIPEAMSDIINKVSFGIASVKKDETDPEHGGQTVELTVKYDGKPVTTCTFKYGTNVG